jgi:hypothetical protein
LKIAAIGLALYAIYLPVAFLVGHLYVPLQRPSGTMTESLQGFVQGPGFSYRTISYLLAKYADASEDNMRSPVMLYEGLKPLGPARSYIRDVQNVGLGHFIFVRFGEDPRSHVVISTSDNSDPRTNGRKYWLVLPGH